MSHRQVTFGIGRPVRAMLFGLLAAGCAGGTGSVDPDLSAGDNLARLARSEARTGRGVAEIAMPPPGVPAEAVERRSPDDPGAYLTMEAAVADALERHEPEDHAFVDQGPADDEARDRALRHYVRGLDAAYRSEYLVAINELENAARLDPTSAAVLRQLGRLYLVWPGNLLKSASYYERLLRLEPGDSEALFTLGLSAINRRQFPAAAAYLGRPVVSGEPFDHDEAAPALASYMLATALEQLGYDRAALELYGSLVAGMPNPMVTPTLYAGQLKSLYLRRGEISQMIGDIHCRLGQYEDALAAYDQSAPLAVDPDALDARIVYADLRLGRQYSAQHQVLMSLGAEAGSVTDRDIRLLGYLARETEDVSLLTEAVLDRNRADPDEPALVRAAAVLLERDGAVQWLQAYLERQPGDLEAVAQLLGWLLLRDPASALELTVALIDAHPELAESYADRLAVAAPSVAGLLAASETLPPTPARAAVRARLLRHVGALGPAWKTVIDARSAWPADAMLLRQQITLAADLREPQLLEAIVAEAEPDDASSLVALSAARRELDRADLAVEAATRAVELTSDDPDRQRALALTELARAQGEQAAAETDTAARRERGRNAADAAEAAIQLQPDLEEAHAALLWIVRPTGPMPDEASWSRASDRLNSTIPGGVVAGKLAARRDLDRGRFPAALERGLRLIDRDPGDAEAIALVITSWLQQRQVDRAVQWLEEGLDKRPADPLRLQEWAEIQIQRNKLGEASARMERVLATEPEHDTARRLLESVRRRQGDAEAAVRLAEVRLLSRPKGIRRELQLAATYVGAGRPEPADERLQWILIRADEATFDQLRDTLRVVARLGDIGAADEPLTLAFAEVTIERFPDAPLWVYGMALRAMALLDRGDARIDGLASRAVRHARGADGPTVQEADQWRQLAQMLVDLHHPAAAGRVLRARLRAEAPLEGAALDRLATAALTADAAADDVEASLELLRELALRGPLPQIARFEVASLEDACYEVSVMYSLLGRDAGARRLLREALALDPTHAMALNNLGYTRIELGYSDDETAGWIARAHELAPKDNNVLDTVGWLRYKLGRFEDEADVPGAITAIEQAIRASEDPAAEVLDHLGDIRWRLGDRVGAAEAWREAVQILENAERREFLIAAYERLQSQAWGLMVDDPARMYDRLFDAVLQRTRQKLLDVGEGRDPDVASTFDELEPRRVGELDDGRS